MDKHVLLRVRVLRGINLAKRDTMSSDPYVILMMGKQKLKTTVKKRSLDPEWNEDLTLSLADPTIPIMLEVYDEDKFSEDDHMGDAVVDIQPLLFASKLAPLKVPDGTAIRRVQPDNQNCFSKESEILWQNGTMVQLMTLKLKNVERGEIELKLTLLNLPMFE